MTLSVHPRISVDEECAGPLPFVEEIEFWRELGVTNVGMISPKLEAIRWDTKLVANSGLRASNVCCEWRVLSEALEFGAAMGSDLVWLAITGSIGSRLWEEAADNFCQQIAPIVTRAAELGVRFAIQPTNSLRLDYGFIFTLRDTLEVARRAGTDVILELECCWYERGLEKLVRENVDRIALVQISDFKIGSTTSPDRSVIGDGDIPLERLLDMILGAGYEGMFDLELVGPKIAAEGYLSATRRSLERATEMLERLGA
ncbi:MAG: sugar phosphate isomerase/epimerase family protein [Acidimicrobiales bacterium]